MSTTIWAASAVTPAGTDRIPVDVSGAGGPSRWTGQQVADVNTLIGGTVTALGSIGTNTAINLALGGYFSATITGNLTFSITNVPASAGVTFVLALTNGGAYTVTLPGSVTIIGGSPVLSAAGTDWLVFRTLDGGTAWTLEVVGNPRDADLATWATITPAANVGTFLATPSSANLAAAVTDETGSGALVFATSPTLVTPALGTPASGILTNCLQTVQRATRQSSALSAASSGETKFQWPDIARSSMLESITDVGDRIISFPPMTDPMVSGFYISTGVTIEYVRMLAALGVNGTSSTSSLATLIPAINYATAASSNAAAGMYSNSANYRAGSAFGDGVLMWGMIGTPDASYGSGATGSKIVAGLHTTVATDGARPGGDGVLFEYNTNQSDTNWQFIASVGGANTIVDTGVAFAQGVWLWVIHMPRGGSACYGYIKQVGGSGASVTAGAIPTSTAMYFVPARLTTLSATARNIRISSAFIRSGGAV